MKKPTCARVGQTVRWTCGYFVGQSKWQNNEIFEPDECGTESTTEIEDENDVELWNENMQGAECPTCHAELTQKWDEPTLIP